MIQIMVLKVGAQKKCKNDDTADDANDEDHH